MSRAGRDMKKPLTRLVFGKNLSFRGRLVLGITALHFVLMTALVFDLLGRQHEFLHQQGHQHAASLVSMLAVSSKSWVMANDIVGLQEVTASVASQSDVRYAMVLTPDLRVLAHSHPERQGLFVTDEASRQLLKASPDAALISLVRSHRLEDTAAPIMAGHTLVGWARVGIAQDSIRATLLRGLLQGGMYIIGSCLVAYVFAMIMAHWLSTGLNRLARGFARVGGGERGLRVRLERRDEIGKLADDFNRMVAELEASEARLQVLATTDFLTGLDNRRSFMEKMNNEMARLQRNAEASVAILLMDLDHFKRVNDTYGHVAGDAVLRHVSAVIRGCLRRVDLAGRFGGEEFILLLPDTSLDGALSFAERIRRAIEQSDIKWDDQILRITVSVGLTLLHAADATPEVAIKRADTALYRAKDNGRNRVEQELCDAQLADCKHADTSALKS